MAVARPTTTLEDMLERGNTVHATCSRCRKTREIDIPDLIATLGPLSSLWNRRCWCRVTPGCKGWNWFRLGPGWLSPLLHDETYLRWIGDEKAVEGSASRDEPLGGPRRSLPGGKPLDAFSALDILNAACRFVITEPVQTATVYQALETLAPHSDVAGFLNSFWMTACMRGPGISRNLRELLNSIVEKVEVPERADPNGAACAVTVSADDVRPDSTEG